MILLMEATHLKIMADAAEAAWPAEACGLIVGRGKGQLIRVTRIVPAANLITDDPHRFELDPTARLTLERELRDADSRDRIIGHYHSHPDGTAAPSATDRAMTHEPDLAWVIIGVTDGQAIQTLAHRLDEKRGAFRPVPIRTQKSPCIPQAEPA